MTTATMERPKTLTETVTVKYVNQPKDGKKGNIRAAAGEYYGMSKPALLDQFAVGETCYVDYFLTDSGFRIAVAKRPVVQSAPRHPVPEGAEPARYPTPQTNGKKMDQQNGNGNARYPTHPRDAERMFTCSILNALIEKGYVRDDVDGLKRAVNDLRQVWQETFGLDEPSNPLAAG